MKRHCTLLLLFLLAIILETKCQTIHQIGYYSMNGIFSISSQTNYLLLGNGELVDVSNPSTPSLAGNVSFNGFSTSILVDSNYVYYGTGMSVNLIIADISNPSFPLQVGSKSFAHLNGGVFGSAKQSNILYLAMGSDGIYSLDVTNKANPIVLDSINFANGQSRDIVIKNNYAFVANGSGLKVLDISNSSNITLDTTIGSGYNSVDLQGNFAFLGKSSGGIDVFDISNPLTPMPAFAIPNAGGAAWDLKVKNDLIYLATNSGGLYIYKYNSTSAVQMAQFANTGNGQSFSVALQDSLIFLSGLVNGVAILQYDSLGTVGLNSANFSNEFKISPNPAKDYINFNLLDKNITEIEIVDMNGKTVLMNQYSYTPSGLDISNIPIGNYIVKFRSQRNQWQKKLIKLE